MSCPSIKRYRSALTSRLCGSQSGIINSCMTNTTRGLESYPKIFNILTSKMKKKVNQYRQLRYSLTKRQSRPRSHLFSYLVFLYYGTMHIYMHKVLYTEKLFIAILLSGQYFIAKSKLSVFHILIDYL